MSEVARLCSNVKPVKGMEYARQALTLSEKIGHEQGISMNLNNLGSAHTTVGNFDSSLVYYQRRLDLVEKMKDTLEVAMTKDNISIIHLYKGNYNIALKLREESNNIYKKADKILMLARGYIWMGNIYLSQEKFDTALQYYLDSKRIYEEKKDPATAYALVNIGTVYRRMKHYQEAIDNLERSKELFAQMGDLNGVGGALYRIATI